MDARYQTSHSRVFAITAGLLVLVAFALFVPLPFGGRIASASGDLVHGPLFGALAIGALWLVQYLRPLPWLTRAFVLRAVVVAFAMMALGLATEVAQIVVRRSASIHDAIANGLGITAATLLYLAWHHKQQQPQRRLPRVAMVAAAGLSLTLAWWSPVGTLWNVLSVRRQFPLIASSESYLELERWYFRQCHGRITEQGATDGSLAMEVTVNPTSEPSATLCEVYPDWSKMQALELDVLLDKSYPYDRVAMLVKVYDRHHRQDPVGTFASQYTLQPGQPKHIRIDREQMLGGSTERHIDLSNIEFISLSILEPGFPTRFFVDNIHLTLQGS